MSKNNLPVTMQSKNLTTLSSQSGTLVGRAVTAIKARSHSLAMKFSIKMCLRSLKNIQDIMTGQKNIYPSLKML